MKLYLGLCAKCGALSNIKEAVAQARLDALQGEARVKADIDLGACSLVRVVGAGPQAVCDGRIMFVGQFRPLPRDLPYA